MTSHAAAEKPKAAPCPACEAEEKAGPCRCGGVVRRFDAAGFAGALPASVPATLAQPGRPLDPATRARMECGFGHALSTVPARAAPAPATGPLRLGATTAREEGEADRLADLAMNAPATPAPLRVDFRAVRVHDGADAARSSSAIGARAYAAGTHLAFATGRYAPHSAEGRRLLAHELAHTLQDGAATVRRDGEDSLLSRAMEAADARQWEVAARLANGLSPSDIGHFIRYLQHQGGNELIWNLHLGATQAAGVGPQSGIALATKATAERVQIARDDADRKRLARENGEPEPAPAPTAPPAGAAPAAAATPDETVQDKLARCRSGEAKNMMVFPLRMPKGMWRIDVAPISAHRAGDAIVVKQPLNGVWANQFFRKETKTLPLATFTGGLRMKPDDVVKVRLYDNDDKVICVTGEDMLKLSAATDTQTILSVARTVVDAASVVAPGLGSGLSKGASLAMGGATIAANIGIEAGSQASLVGYGLKDRIDWAGLAFDAFIQIVTLRLGGALGETAANAIASKVEGQFTREALRWAVKAVMAGGVNAFSAALKSAFDRYRGARQDMTWEQLIGEIGAQFAMGALFEATIGYASQAPRNPTPEPAALPPAGKPATPAPEPPAAVVPKGKAAATPVKPAPPRKAPPPERAVNPGEALAHEDLPGNHELVVTGKGVARCSPAPCPIIEVEFARELDAHPEMKARVAAIQDKRLSHPEQAGKDAAALVRELEAVRNNAAANARRGPEWGGERPADPDRGTSRERWKAQDSARRESNRIDRIVDDLEVPRVKGTEASGYTIDGRRVPQKQQRRVDIGAQAGGRDAELPVRPGETPRQAVARVQGVIGKRISDFPLLEKMWNEARISAQTSESLSADNYGKLYDRTRNGFWRRVTARTPEGAAARAILDAAGLAPAAGKRGAAQLAGVDPSIKRAEITVSLDHAREKAIGDNWRFALDADNLVFEFAMPNTNRENIQMRHGRTIE